MFKWNDSVHGFLHGIRIELPYMTEKDQYKNIKKPCILRMSEKHRVLP